MKGQKKPVIPALTLGVIVLGCLCARWIVTKDPAYLDLAHCDLPPGGEFLFGTDALGRDVFSMIWAGGQVSLGVGFLSTLISTAVAVVFGAASGMAPPWLDLLLTRLADLLLSVPNLLLVIFLQAVFGEASVWSVSLAIGLTSWVSVAKVVRTETKRICASEYVLAAKAMGGGFFHMLRRHLIPNFIPSILFMVVMNVRGAMAAESTLSFLGMGLPLETVSWGGMLSLSEKALLSGSWWVILIPGAFLAVTLLCVTELGNYLRGPASRRRSGL